MRITFDPEANAAYLRIRPGTVYETVELTDSVYLDVDAEGLVLGVELLNVRDLTRVVGDSDGVLEIPDCVNLDDRS